MSNFRQIRSLLLLGVKEIKLALCKINLELRTLNIVVSAYFSVSLRVLYKVLTALSLAIQTARLWRGGPVPGRWTAGPGRLRQLGLSPNVNHCLWNRWTLRRFIRCVHALKTEALLRLFPLCDMYRILRSTFMLRLDLSRSIFVRRLWFVINDVLWYQSIMSRKNNIPGIAMYGIIDGIWT